MMDQDYGDFGSDTDTSGDDMGLIDSDEEQDRDDNLRLLKMLTPPKRSTSKTIVENFETEMEAELDQRALEVERDGGVLHQKSLSRSSSSSSLNSVGRSATKPSTSSSGCPPKKKKTVRFESTVGGGGGGDLEDLNVKEETSKPPTGSQDGQDEKKPPQNYDEIYFDSDESEGDSEEVKTTRKKKRNFQSNDDLFYDPNSDERDQEWVDAQRRKQLGDKPPKPSKSKSPKGLEPLPNSDAVLNCPACFTLLCLDCQRHEFYTGQYRAMFVSNCLINREETIQIPIKDRRAPKRKKDQNVTPGPTGTTQGGLNDEFHPVKCKVCNTQVAAFDKDEIFHFFNVLSSHS